MAELLESVLNQILQAQATEQLRAEYYERTYNLHRLPEWDLSSHPLHLGGKSHLTSASHPERSVLHRHVCPVDSGANRHLFSP